MITFRRQTLASATLLLIALACSGTAQAQINVRGYVDLRPQAGPVVLVGDRGFTLLTSYSFWNNASGIFNCNTSPGQCVPGATLNLRAAHNDEGAIVTLDGTTHSPVGGSFDNDSFDATFTGSLTLPASAPTAVASTSFTFQGRFSYQTPGQPPASVDLAGSGLADVYLRRYSDPSFPTSWFVERVVYRLNQAPIPALLTYADIGAVGIAGGSRFSNGDFIVSGAGGDIWGAADAFHYLFKAVDNGGSISARVMSLSASQPFAKAGVMLRGGLGADAAHVVLDVKPDGGVEFMTRSATGGNTTFIAGATTSFPVWLRLTVKGSSVTALMSSDAHSWQTVGTTTIDGSGPSWRRTLGGFAVTSHDTQTLAQAAFEEPSIGLDWPWAQADIGAMTRSDANAEFVDLAYLVSGTGADIWGTADAFHFLYQPHQSDGLIVARIDSEQDTNPFAKAGVMIRDAIGSSTDPGAKHVILDVRPNGAVEFMARTASGGSTAYLGGTTRAFPAWLKLERHGDTITGSTSADGAAWAAVGSIDVPMGVIPNFGVAVTSHDTSTLNTARVGTLFVETTEPGAPPPPPPSAPPNVVVYASDIPASAMHGVWAPRSDSTSPNNVKLSTPAGSAPNTSAPLATPADYVDVPFTSATNTRYTLWIRVRATNDSKLSDSFWVQFSDALANGTPVYPIGTTSGLLVNLATDSTASSLHNWGWADGAYWLSQSATFTFSNTTGTLRIQPREYGVEIDQIVLSPGTYLNPNASCPTSCAFAPGPINNDTTTVPKP